MVPEWAAPVWHQFVVRHPARNAFRSYLSEARIGTLIHYPIPPHLSGAYKESGWKAGEFPITEQLANTVLSLPMGPHLDEICQQAVISQVRDFAWLSANH